MKLKYITECVIRGKKYYLVRCSDSRNSFYGTIPMEYVDENLTLTKRISGLAMCLENTRDSAIETRERVERIGEWMNANPNADRDEYVKFYREMLRNAA